MRWNYSSSKILCTKLINQKYASGRVKQRYYATQNKELTHPIASLVIHAKKLLDILLKMDAPRNVLAKRHAFLSIGFIQKTLSNQM